MKSCFKWNILRFVVIFIYSFLFLVGLEYTAFKDIEPVITWFKEYPLYFILTAVAISFLFFAFTALCNFFVGSLLTGIVAWVFGMVNYFKYSMRKDFVTGDDIYNFFHGNLEFSNSDIDYSKHLFYFLGAYIFLTLISFFINKGFNSARDFKYRWYMRTIGMFVGVLLTASTCLVVYFQENMKDFIEGSEYIGGKYGLILGYIPSNTMPHMVISKDYKPLLNKDYVRKGHDKIEGNVDKSKTNAFIKPNVIVIMSESLYDTDHFDNVKCDTDPLKNIHEIQSKYGGGSIEVDIFGGGTANTEWEFLTGMGHKYFSSNLMYYKYGDGSVEHKSMVSYMKDMGYHTVAIHPYKGSFFNRIDTYKSMGFDETYFRENMTHTKELFDVNISDYALTDEIIEKYENVNASSDAPFFNFSISVGSHKPCLDYDEGKPYEYKEHLNVLPKEGNFDTTSSRDLKRYYNAVYEADEAFKELCDYFANVSEPTVIMMFGDHAPPLMDETYADATIKDLSDEELYETPVVCYNNYGLDKFEVNRINANYLTTEFFKYLDFPLPKALVYNDNLMKYWYQCNNKKVVKDKDGNDITKMSKEMMKLEKATLSLYQGELRNKESLKDIWDYKE